MDVLTHVLKLRLLRGGSPTIIGPLVKYDTAFLGS